jgi:hypothetical protein
VNILADWVARGANSVPELAATVARLSINIAGINVTEFKFDREERLRLHVMMPAYVLAEGLTHRWWTLVGARGRTINLRTFRQGFAVPDVAITPDATNLHIVAKSFRYENPPVSFINNAEENSARSDFESELRSFIERVIAQAAEIGETELSKYWRSIQISEQNASERAFCVAAGALGCDPYSISNDDAQLIQQASGIFLEEQLSEFLSAIAVQNTRDAITWIQSEEDRLGARLTLPTLDTVSRTVRRKIHRSGESFEIGYEAARQTRIALNRPPDARFDSVDTLARAFGTGDFDVSRHYVPGIRAVADSGSGRRTKILVSGGNLPPQSKLFSLARAVGDTIVFESQRAAITDNETSRQAVGRAFAAELLAPAEIVLDHYREGWTIEDIALERGVSGKVIEHQIENHLKGTSNNCRSWESRTSLG